jgi:hypothetical protein
MSQVKTVKEVLVAARWIIDNIGWCQGAFARTTDGRGIFVNFRETKAAAYCSVGAICVVEKSDRALENQAYSLLKEVIGFSNDFWQMGIPGWNDNSYTTKQRVLEVFDQAIERAQ